VSNDLARMILTGENHPRQRACSRCNDGWTDEYLVDAFFLQDDGSFVGHEACNVCIAEIHPEFLWAMRLSNRDFYPLETGSPPQGVPEDLDSGWRRMVHRATAIAACRHLVYGQERRWPLTALCTACTMPFQVPAKNHSRTPGKDGREVFTAEVDLRFSALLWLQAEDGLCSNTFLARSGERSSQREANRYGTPPWSSSRLLTGSISSCLRIDS
jgi:hypothetical protein